MLDVLELEKRWSKYHSRQMLPRYITSFIFVIIAAGSSYLYVTNSSVITSLAQEKPAPEKAPVVVKVVEKIQPVQQTPKEEVYSQNILVPSFNFIKVLENQSISFYNAQKLASIAKAKKRVKVPKPKKRVVKPKKKPLPAPKKVAVKAPAKVQKKVVTPKKAAAKEIPPTAIVIGANSSVAQKQEADTLIQVGQNSTSKDELRGVIKRFNRSKKPALSLFISKKYYEQGNYKEAYNYAKETYKLNPNIEGGVLLYAKSLTKLGKPDIAIKKLKPYIKKSGSIKAMTLLNEIKKGNFK